jgi:hypothetical protein
MESKVSINSHAEMIATDDAVSDPDVPFVA